VTGSATRRRIRLFVLLSGALILASLVPLLVAEAVLIRRNRRTLETLEEKYLTRLDLSVVPPAIQHLVDDRFSIQHGVSTGKPNAGPGSGCIEKHDPFPAIRIRFDDFKLDSLVFHDHPP